MAERIPEPVKNQRSQYGIRGFAIAGDEAATLAWALLKILPGGLKTNVHSIIASARAQTGAPRE
jgi:hypothetical protein